MFPSYFSPPPLSLTHTHTLSLTHTHKHTLFHTHAHTHTLSHMHTHTHSLFSLSISFLHYPCLIFCLCLSFFFSLSFFPLSVSQFLSPSLSAIFLYLSVCLPVSLSFSISCFSDKLIRFCLWYFAMFLSHHTHTHTHNLSHKETHKRSVSSLFSLSLCPIVVHFKVD